MTGSEYLVHVRNNLVIYGYGSELKSVLEDLNDIILNAEKDGQTGDDIVCKMGTPRNFVKEFCAMNGNSKRGKILLFVKIIFLFSYMLLTQSKYPHPLMYIVFTLLAGIFLLDILGGLSTFRITGAEPERFFNAWLVGLSVVTCAEQILLGLTFAEIPFNIPTDVWIIGTIIVKVIMLGLVLAAALTLYDTLNSNVFLLDRMLLLIGASSSSQIYLYMVHHISVRPNFTWENLLSMASVFPFIGAVILSVFLQKKYKNMREA